MTAQTPLGLIVAVSASLCATGCMVGPNFKRPAPPAVAGYTSEPLAPTGNAPNAAGGNAQQFVTGQDIPGDWWTVFQSPSLNALIGRALQNSPTLKSANAALVSARETVLAQRGAYYPSVSAGLSASKARTSSELSPVPNSGDLTYSLYTPQVGVSYVADVFGLNRRTVESLAAQAESARYALAAAHITLSASVATAAITEASLRAQIAATRENIATATDTLDIVRRQFAAGYVSRLDVAAQESQLAQVTATLPPLLKQLDQERDLLAVLVGSFPGDGLPEQFELSALQLPSNLPLSVPSALVEQRPDVRQAEANLHAASAQIGAAVASRLPTFTLTADLGSMALAFSRLFAAGTEFWDLSAGVTQSVFQGGTLIHRERAAEAAYAAAGEQYRGVVLTAFQNVADTLHALEQDAAALAAAAAATDAARVTLDLARTQYRAGYVSYLSLLNAQSAYGQAMITLAQAQANRYADTAALFEALGGGWWHRTDISQ